MGSWNLDNCQPQCSEYPTNNPKKEPYEISHRTLANSYRNYELRSLHLQHLLQRRTMRLLHHLLLWR